MTKIDVNEFHHNSSAATVSLWSAKIPLIGLIAVHHWFVVTRGNTNTRWEVWQSVAAGDTYWGHLHKDLMEPHAWKHQDEPICHQVWYAAVADKLAKRIESSPQFYPWKNSYRYWPGPNSNTYVQWVLRSEFKLGWRAAGKHYSRLA